MGKEGAEEATYLSCILIIGSPPGSTEFLKMTFCFYPHGKSANIARLPSREEKGKTHKPKRQMYRRWSNLYLPLRRTALDQRLDIPYHHILLRHPRSGRFRCAGIRNVTQRKDVSVSRVLQL
jgi:hypothetical protein